MLGDTMGELSLRGWSQGAWAILWKKVGDQGAEWLRAEVLVPHTVSQLQFVATTGSGSSSDIAIDALDGREQLGFLSQPRSMQRAFLILFASYCFRRFGFVVFREY